MIIYDTDARLRDEPISLKTDGSLRPKEPTQMQLQELETATAHDRNQYLSSPNYPPHKYHNPQYTLQVPPDVLRFDSKFESGNLKKVLRTTDNEYELHLNNDIETKGHTQWYYFSVRSFKSSHTVRFNLVNFYKFESLYNEGLQPCVYSVTKYKRTGVKWHRGGSSIAYYQNSRVRRKLDDKEKSYYTLTFTYTFEYASDTVYFAHCYPYTYTELLSDIEQYKTLPDIVRVNDLCMSLAGNPLPLLTITQDVESYLSWEVEQKLMNKTKAGRLLERNREARLAANSRLLDYYHDRKSERKPDHRRKKGIVLTARVHPGESGGSYMMQGALEFLLGNSREAKVLRKNFVFKIVPMLNPDGVIYGNNRCSLLGVDLNRRWRNPMRLLHPEIFYTKRLITVFSEMHEVAVFCDMHGHSAKKDVFMYGCCCTDSKTDWMSSANTTYSTQVSWSRSNVLIKTLPIVFGLKTDLFNYDNCHFRMEPSKSSTARIVLFEELDILGSYTLEASFYGSPENNELKASNGHMLAGHLESIGKDLCKSLIMYANRSVFAKHLSRARNFLKGKEQQNIRNLPEIEAIEVQSVPMIDFLKPFEEQSEDSDNETDELREEASWEEKIDVEYRLRKLQFEPTQPEAVGKFRLTEPHETLQINESPPHICNSMADLFAIMSDGDQEDFKKSESCSDSGGSGAEESEEEKDEEKISPLPSFKYKRRRLPSTAANMNLRKPASRTLKTLKNIRANSLTKNSPRSGRPNTAECPVSPLSPKITIRSRLIPSFGEFSTMNRSFIKSRESPKRELLKPKLIFCPSRPEKTSTTSLSRNKGRRLSTNTRAF